MFFFFETIQHRIVVLVTYCRSIIEPENEYEHARRSALCLLHERFVGDEY